MNPLNFNFGAVAERIRSLIELPLRAPAEPAVAPLAPDVREEQERRNEQAERSEFETGQKTQAQERRIREDVRTKVRTPGAQGGDAAGGRALGQSEPRSLPGEVAGRPGEGAPKDPVAQALVQTLGRAAVLETRLDALQRAAERGVSAAALAPLAATVQGEVDSLRRDARTAAAMLGARESSFGGGAQAASASASAAAVAAAAGAAGASVARGPEASLFERLEQLGAKLAKSLAGLDSGLSTGELKELRVLRGELKELSYLAAQGGAASADDVHGTAHLEALASLELQHAGELEPMDPAVAEFLEAYFRDEGEFAGKRPWGARAKLPAEALSPQKLAALAKEAAAAALGLSPERLREGGLDDRLRLWSVWATNRLIECGGDTERAKAALMGDILRAPETQPMLVRDLRQGVGERAAKGELPQEAAEKLLSFIDANRHTVLPQWMGEVLSRGGELPSREELLEALSERMEEHLWGASTEAASVPGRRRGGNGRGGSGGAGGALLRDLLRNGGGLRS